MTAAKSILFIYISGIFKKVLNLGSTIKAQTLSEYVVQNQPVGTGYRTQTSDANKPLTLHRAHHDHFVFTNKSIF